MAALSLQPVSQAVYARLRSDSTLLAALPGGIRDDVPQTPTYPFLWYEVQERDIRGFGTGGLPEVELRLHVFSTYAGLQDAQTAMRLAIARLKDVALTVTGYAFCGHVFYDETILLSEEVINGVKVRELVSAFRLYVEEV